MATPQNPSAWKDEELETRKKEAVQKMEKTIQYLQELENSLKDSLKTLEEVKDKTNQMEENECTYYFCSSMTKHLENIEKLNEKLTAIESVQAETTKMWHRI